MTTPEPVTEAGRCRALTGHPWPLAIPIVRDEVNSNLTIWTGRQTGGCLRKNGEAVPKRRETGCWIGYNQQISAVRFSQHSRSKTLQSRAACAACPLHIFLILFSHQPCESSVAWDKETGSGSLSTWGRSGAGPVFELPACGRQDLRLPVSPGPLYCLRPASPLPAVLTPRKLFLFQKRQEKLAMATSWEDMIKYFLFSQVYIDQIFTVAMGQRDENKSV